MIARVWRGAVRREDAEVYGAVHQRDRHRGIRGHGGQSRSRALLRPRRAATWRSSSRFSLWDSMDAVRGFAGD